MKVILFIVDIHLQLDGERSSTTVYFPSPTQSPAGFLFQIPASSQSTTSQSQSARSSQNFDPRECARRRLINKGNLAVLCELTFKFLLLRSSN